MLEILICMLRMLKIQNPLGQKFVSLQYYQKKSSICRLERDAKLGALEERADALQDGCAQFEKQAAAMKNKFWMENLKSMIAAGVVGVIVLGLIYWKFFMAPPAPAYPYPPPPPPPPPPSGGDAGGSSELVNPKFARWY